MDNNIPLTLKFLIFISIVLVLALLYVIFYVPEEVKRKKRKKKEVVQTPADDMKQEMEDLRERMEKQIHHLKTEMAGLEKTLAAKDKELLAEKAEAEKFKEKIQQERGWHEKELGEMERRGKEIHTLKNELIHWQESSAKEHAETIQLKHQLLELKSEFSVVNDQRRAAEGESAALKEKLENSRQEITQLKRENIELNKKKEDTQWIAKTEYARLERLLVEKDKEMERIKRVIKDETM